jgi:hypothetical protein
MSGLFGQGLRIPPSPPVPRHRKVFFSFHYEDDCRLAAQIRNSNVIRGVQNAGYADAVAWEELRRQGDDAIRRWINAQLDGTSVTVVLIGQNTATRPWVRYEIERSMARGNGLLGIHMHMMTDPLFPRAPIRMPGGNPFSTFASRTPMPGAWLPGLAITGRTLEDSVDSYCWVVNQGYDNFSKWIERAAQRVGK